MPATVKRGLPHIRKNMLPVLEGALCKGDIRFVIENPYGRTPDANQLACKNICSRCPVQELCLDYALKNNESKFIWGGLTPSERIRLKRKLS